MISNKTIADNGMWGTAEMWMNLRSKTCLYTLFNSLCDLQL